MTTSSVHSTRWLQVPRRRARRPDLVAHMTEFVPWTPVKTSASGAEPPTVKTGRSAWFSRPAPRMRHALILQTAFASLRRLE